MPRKSSPSDPQPEDLSGETQKSSHVPGFKDYTGPGTYAPGQRVDDAPEGMVIYQGPYGTREISDDQWLRAGVQEQSSVVWNSQNRYMLPVQAFTEHALRVLRVDQEFRIT